MVKGDANNHWAIKGGDATASAALRTLFDGPRPCAGKPPACVDGANHSYNPMRKYGAIILGIGGDVSEALVLRLLTLADMCHCSAEFSRWRGYLLRGKWSERK